MWTTSYRDEVDVPKLKEFKGMRFTRDVENFLWGNEQYFCASVIEDGVTKVNTTSMYFTDVTILE